MTKIPQQGVLLSSAGRFRHEILDFIRQAAEKRLFDAVMLPMRVPAKDSYAWIMIRDFSLLPDAVSMSPIMPVNAAKALKSITRKGEGSLRIAVLMRPCEVRAAIELIKLNQIQKSDLLILSYDCPGALPMQDYINNPEWGEAEFDKILAEKLWHSDIVKPTCKTCDKFSLPASDLHFGIEGDNLILVANSVEGKAILDGMNLSCRHDLAGWQQRIDKISLKRAAVKEETYKVIKTKVDGFANLLDTFSECIGCHNCQSVCPICYCRQCYFDSAASRPNSDLVLMRTQRQGSLSLPLDRLMFHTGRMAHMSLSCVACGLCSDACPVNIPVAKIFSYVGSETQKTFEYVAGESLGDALPMKEYKAEELGELGNLIKNAEAHGGDHE